jgi:AcrR family transcriptional regulator
MGQRRKQPEQTRRAILDAVGAELSRHGYAATGLGAIVARANLTKGALFHHFPDKQTLVLAWITGHLAAAIGEQWIAPLEPIASLDTLRAFCRDRCLDMTAEDDLPILAALTAETAATDPVLGGALGRIFNRWQEEFASLLERGKRDGWIHRSIEPAAEAAFITAAFSGFAVTTRTDSGEAMRRGGTRALEGYLETLRAQ